MILTCPDCATRYSAEGEAIGPNGRTVRCSKCDATWFIEGEALAVPDELALSDLEHAQDFDLPEDEPLHVPEEYQVPQSRVRPYHPGAHVLLRKNKERIQRGRKLIGVRAIWAVALGSIAVMLTLGIVNRHNLVQTYPSTATLYQAIGMDVTRSGFDFADVKTSNSLVDGQAVFIVNGTVRNLRGRSGDAPLVELSFLDVADKPITTWLVDVDKRTLPGKGTAEFAAQYPNPPLDAAALRYRFIHQAVKSN